MNKEQIKQLVKSKLPHSQKKIDLEELWKILDKIQYVPTTLRERLTPTYFKKGDIFKRCGLDHPYVLWEKIEPNRWIAIILTSKDNDNTSEKVEGKYENTYYSYTLTMITNPLMSDYCGNIENIEQLNKVVEKLLTMFLKPYKNKQSKSRLS